MVLVLIGFGWSVSSLAASTCLHNLPYSFFILCFAIVPENVDIHVLIDIDPKNITNVFEGAKVKILLDAMPSQKHGELVGKLISISKDTRDEDISGEKSSMYRGKVKIVENNLRNTPKDFALLPGMNVSGNVISGTRPLITYLIYPVIKTINTAMREP